jgi:endonuclease/exonuclease/phosphatase family metal-dependent hydrolase
VRSADAPTPPVFRLVTYNIRAARGLDGRYDLERIARVLGELSPDLVCLQEVDVRRVRSGRVDQPQELALRLGMDNCRFAAAWNDWIGAYGNAVLSRVPFQTMRTKILPIVRSPALSETRGAIWVRVPIGGEHLDIVSTHLSLRPAARRRQIDALLGPTWMASSQMGKNRVLAGDFNEIPGGPGYQRLVTHLRDSQYVAGTRIAATWPSRYPLLRLDHVLVSSGLDVRRAYVSRGSAARIASDHLPVLVELTPYRFAAPRPAP